MGSLLDDERRSQATAVICSSLAEFAASDPVPGLNDGTLQLAFMDLRQLMDLFLEWDWTHYVADHGKPHNKYIRVPAATCILLLEKSVFISFSHHVPCAL